MPPDPKAEPEVEANAEAWDWIPGSSAACLERTSLRMERKRGFSEKVSGVGGSLEVVPIERFCDGGDVGMSAKMCEDEDVELGKTY